MASSSDGERLRQHGGQVQVGVGDDAVHVGGAQRGELGDDLGRRLDAVDGPRGVHAGAARQLAARA